MQRRVRDLSCGDTRIFLELEVRRVDCRRCGRVKRQQLDFLADNPLYTKRFAYFVGRRCRGATIKDVAEELKLDWHTVKTLDQQYMEAQLERAGRPGPQVIGVDEIAIRAQEDFALDAKLKIGNDIWTPETAGARFYEQVLSKKPTTVQKAIDLASELKEQPFTAKQVMGHLKWLFTTGELEVDGKSYTPKTKEPKAAKAPQAKPEAKAKKAEVKAAATRKRSFVKTKKLAA
jgi:hypothetical protein